MVENVKFEGFIKEVLKREFDKKNQVFQKIRLDSGVLIRCYKFEGLEVGKHFSGDCQSLEMNTPEGNKIKLYFCKEPIISGIGSQPAPNMPQNQTEHSQKPLETQKTQSNASNEFKAQETLKQTDWDSKERRSLRAMCISYAKDLCVAGLINIANMDKIAREMVTWVYAAKPETEDGKEVEGRKAPADRPPETDIPF